MEMIKGTEWCAFCECETDFEVDEDTWIVTCKNCGRPLVLCDKCYTMYGSYGRTCYNGGCKECKHCEDVNKKATELMREWEKNQIGKVVYWNDPDNGLCSCECVIESIDDCIIHLRNNKGGFIDAYDTEIDWKYKK